MGAIVFICPESGRAFSPGIDTDEYTFESIRHVILYLSCPCCGETREFTVEDAHLSKAA